MSLKKMQAIYGLKWNPFAQDIPAEAIVKTPRFDQFCYRIETLVLEGGFALITGESGLGKSVSLRALSAHLSKMPEIRVGEITRPQSGLADFYREMSSIFGVDIKVSNRWGGYKSLREKWRHHIESTLLRPVLLIDEAQQTQACVLNELRLLTMEKFDSICLMTIVLAGDERLTNAFKQLELVPLGTRIRTRLVVEPWMKSQLVELIQASCSQAGNPNLITAGLAETIAEHSVGNPRILMNLAAECLAMGLRKEASMLDEQIFFDLFTSPSNQSPARKKTAPIIK